MGENTGEPRTRSRILMSPAHYLLDDRDRGSEYTWVSEIIKGIAATGLFSLDVVTGRVKHFGVDPQLVRIHQVFNSDKVEMSNQMGIVGKLSFMVRKSARTRVIMRRERPEILHHLFPFSIGETFDPEFLFKRARTSYVLGPVQNPHVGFTDELPDGPIARSALGLYGVAGRRLSAATLRNADRVVAVNEYTAGLLREEGVTPERISVIPPGVDTSRFRFYSMKQKEPRKVEILTVGYLNRRKGVADIIDAVGLLVRDHPDVFLRIVGDGPEMLPLRDRVKSKGLEEAVIFEGFVPNKDIQGYYGDAHVFVSMSRSEAFATVCLEAMASGLAIVSSRVGGFVDAIDDGVEGFIVDGGDPRTLAERLSRLLGDRRLMADMGEAARKKAEARFDWSRAIIPGYLALYDELLGSW